MGLDNGLSVQNGTDTNAEKESPTGVAGGILEISKSADEASDHRSKADAEDKEDEELLQTRSEAEAVESA